MSGGKFLKEWQFTDKIIKWNFFQLTHNLLQMTQTQEIINHRVSKMDMRGCVCVGESFLTNNKLQIKLLSGFFLIYIQSFTNDSNSKNNNL